ncbi:MAG TPA: site-2 protease family protein [Allosphingosinicella sp.]|jgi:Zn-dependent protease
MNPDNILFRIATWVIPLVFAIVLHEVSHGWVANAFGDPTARRKRRLSLNPLRHVDPIGTVALPLALAVAGAPIFGWAKPVPVVPHRLRNPRLHMMLVALAGPGMNLLLAVLAAFALAGIRWLAPGDTVLWLFIVYNVANFLIINVFLAVFNMLPIPPFDGAHVVEGLLPRPMAARYASLGRFGFPFLLFLLVALPLLAPRLNLVAAVVEPPVRLIVTLLGLPLS